MMGGRLVWATLISTGSWIPPWELFEVSMPSHGQHSFLLYPFKTLYFMRKNAPLFADNSQNILKKAVFRGFTCMFTVCSYLDILLVLVMPFTYTLIIAYFS